MAVRLWWAQQAEGIQDVVEETLWEDKILSAGDDFSKPGVHFAVDETHMVERKKMVVMSSNLVYLPLWQAGVWVPALVDSGASFNLCNPKMCHGWVLKTFHSRNSQS